MAESVPCAVCGDLVALDLPHSKLLTDPVGHEGPPDQYRICQDCENNLNEPIP